MENDFFKTILECPENEIETLVAEKIKELESSPSTERKEIVPNERLYGYESYYKGFIKKDVKIYSSMGQGSLQCYTLGNHYYLVDFIKYLRNNHIQDIDQAIKSFSSFVDNYFGEYRGEDKRSEFLETFHGNATIDAFKGKGLAACSEKAAIVNNIIEMLGLNSIYVTGYVQLPDMTESEQHAFNIMINKRNEFVLIDSSCCCGLYDKDDNEIGSATYYYNMGTRNEKLDSFLLKGVPFRLPEAIATINEEGNIMLSGNGEYKSYKAEPILLEEGKEKNI